MSRQVKIVSPTGSPFAVAVMFFGNGLVLASSFSRMPGIRDQVGAIPTQLAFALVCVGIGSIVGMPFTGRLVDRYSAMSAAGEVPGRGSRAIAVVSTIGYGGFLFGAPLIGFLAHMMPLDRALLAVAALVLLVAILAPVAREHGRELAKA